MGRPDIPPETSGPHEVSRVLKPRYDEAHTQAPSDKRSSTSVSTGGGTGAARCHDPGGCDGSSPRPPPGTGRGPSYDHIAA